MAVGIKPAFIKAQIVKSRSSMQTSAFLRKLIFSTVDRVAKMHYQEGYAARCLQTSVAVKALLDRFGIGSSVWVGAVCTAGVNENPDCATWAGFWDADHHTWLQTEFGECVDLSISQLHLHPATLHSGAVPMPAIWWEDIGQWPPVIRYLHDTRIDGIALPEPADAADLDLFLQRVEQAMSERIEKERVDQVTFGPLLSNVESMEALTKQAHPWLVGALRYQDAEMPFPPWIQERQAELIAAWQQGVHPVSRLGSRTDLIGVRSRPCM